VQLLTSEAQTVDLDRDWVPQVKLTVPKRAARRLRIEKSSIIRNTGLDVLIVKEADGTDGHQVVIIRGKNADILDKARRVIQHVCREVQAESELELNIPLDLHGLILGAQWKAWSDLVLRCGGPSDLQLQKEIIEM
jgi:hypothetical protein